MKNLNQNKMLNSASPGLKNRQSTLTLVGIFLLMILLSVKVAFGQTNPMAQVLPYSQNFAGFTGSTTVYPAGFQGWTVAGSLGSTYPNVAPTANQALAGGTNASTTAGVYDMNGKACIIFTTSNMRTL